MVFRQNARAARPTAAPNASVGIIAQWSRMPDIVPDQPTAGDRFG
jgi:hypothetical protein